MFNHSVVLLFAALLTGWMGFGVLSGIAARIAKFLCAVCLAFFAYTMYREGNGWGG